VGTLAGTQVAIPEGNLAGAQAGTPTQMGTQAMHTINKPPSNPSRNSGGEMGSIGMTIISLGGAGPLRELLEVISQRLPSNTKIDDGIHPICSIDCRLMSELACSPMQSCGSRS